MEEGILIRNHFTRIHSKQATNDNKCHFNYLLVLIIYLLPVFITHLLMPKNNSRRRILYDTPGSRLTEVWFTQNKRIKSRGQEKEACHAVFSTVVWYARYPAFKMVGLL
jgi:hypothetical protein